LRITSESIGYYLEILILSDQNQIDSKNVQFWNELCGSRLADSLGIMEITPENLCRFDDAYLSMYPYLLDYVLTEGLEGKKILEIGLGYGTLFGKVLASTDCEYHGLDIAEGPVAMMRYRLSLLSRGSQERVQVGSALDVPYEDECFDYVYSIGCLHHTGNLPRAVEEVYRILKRGGKAIVMLYNRHSFRQCVHAPFIRLFTLFLNRHSDFRQRVRALYDQNVNGEAAPCTDYVSRAEARQLFEHFEKVKIDIRNFDDYTLAKSRIGLRREWLLNNVGRFIGLDLYITATK
jgi:ubiquinone/menaquinone biosynthesis C-methylase UbiE